MNKIRTILAIIIGKILINLSQMLGNQGSDFPGRISRKIDPEILKKLALNIKNEIIIITGTNGKTTTSNMLAAIIREKGYSYAHNRAGANMLGGITTSFIKASDWKGSRQLDYALLETDEANVPLVIKEVKVHKLLITNFFRDQLDRYGELDYTIKIIKEAVSNSKIQLILNADDPLVVHFKDQTALRTWFFGFNETSYDQLKGEESREGRFCVLCGHELSYQRYHYAQLGKFNCFSCDNQNPDRDFTADELKMNPEIEFNINGIAIKSPYQGFYNAYNILAAVSVAKLLEIDDKSIQRAITTYNPQAGRMESFIVNDKRVVLVLIKNPTGFNQSLAALLQDIHQKNLFIALNDNAADGKDISWIWDADIEILANTNMQVNKIITSGQRSGDMAVRVKYCEYPKENIFIMSDYKEGIVFSIEAESEVAYILCTYTAIFECRKILLGLEKSGLPAGKTAKISQKIPAGG